LGIETYRDPIFKVFILVLVLKLIVLILSLGLENLSLCCLAEVEVI